MFEKKGERMVTTENQPKEKHVKNTFLANVRFIKKAQNISKSLFWS